MTFLKETLAQKWGEFSDLNEFANSSLQDGRFSVTVDTGRFECLFGTGAEPRLFVLLAGARNPESHPLPKFDRWRWRELFPGSVLYIGDPTLYVDENLHIGWYVGTSEHDWTRAMAALVQEVTKHLGIPSNQVICYGSSAGGFGALMLAAELGDATAVAVNPQTEIAKYSPRFVKHFLTVAFGELSLAQLPVGECKRFSAIDAVGRTPSMKFLLAQNVQDVAHYRSHYTPFCKHFGIPLEGGVNTSGHGMSLLFDSPSGHGAEPKELAPELIRRSIELTSLISNQDKTKMFPVTEAATPAVPSLNDTLTIRNLPLTEEMAWLDIADGNLTSIEIHSLVKAWPAKSRSTALLLFDFAESVEADQLKQHGISLSKTGAYVYLDSHVNDSIFAWSGTLPPVKVRRIGFRLWGWRKPIVLQNLNITVSGGTFDILTSNKVWDGIASQQDETVIAVDLLANRSECGSNCPTLWNGWNSRMDSYHIRSRNSSYGRTDCFHQVDEGRHSYVSAFHAKPAMLRIPKTIDAYSQSIGDKSRNMVRKAIRAGYQYVTVDANNYIDDVMAVRLSAPTRQGKPIPAYFFERPEKIVYNQECPYHGDGFYGIFKGGKLVAYTTLYFYGQIAQVNHILGHAEFLKDGIMNLLMHEVVNDLIENKPWVRAINYLYSGARNGASGTALFKRSIGFEPLRLIVAYDDEDLSETLEEQRAQRETEQKAMVAAQRRLEAKPAPRIDSAELSEAMIIQECSTRAVALDFLVYATMLERDKSCMIHHVKYSPENDDCASPRSGETKIIVIDEVDSINIVKFLSIGLKQLRSSMAKGAFLLFDIPRDVDSIRREPLAVRADESDSLLSVDPLQSTLDYFKRRFKSMRPSVENIRDGFKGSDFVLRGLGNYPADDGSPSSLLLLKKIR